MTGCARRRRRRRRAAATADTAHTNRVALAAVDVAQPRRLGTTGRRWAVEPRAPETPATRPVRAG